MSDANKAVVLELYRRHNAGDFDVFDELMSDDFVEHERLPGLEPTRAGVRHLFEMIHAAFEKATFEVHDIIAEGDKVSVLARLTGIHRAEFMGVAASGHPIDVGVSDWLRLEDGRVAEHWGVMDTGALMQQISGH